MAQMVMNLPLRQETRVRSLGWEIPLEKGMAIHSSIPAWRIPRTEKPGRLQSMGSQESDTTEQLTQSTTFGDEWLERETRGKREHEIALLPTRSQAVLMTESLCQMYS